MAIKDYFTADAANDLVRAQAALETAKGNLEQAAANYTAKTEKVRILEKLVALLEERVNEG